MIKSKPHFNEEQSLWTKGYSVIGADEVGRGAFAGPVVVAAVTFDPKRKCSDYLLSNVDDSKRLSAKKRAELVKYIYDEALAFHISHVSVSIINKIGIGKATFVAFRNAVTALIEKNRANNYYLLVDGFRIPHLLSLQDTNQKAIIKGDQISVSIAAASIIAKVYRDSLMEKLHEKYRAYDFFSNKGYGTLYHRQMLIRHGISKIHRVAFCHQ